MVIMQSNPGEFPSAITGTDPIDACKRVHVMYSNCRS